MEKDIGKISKNETTDIVVRVDDFGGRKGITIREFVTSEMHRGNKSLAIQYNLFLKKILEWRAEHISLVDDYIKQFGEVYGTGKPPLEWLHKLYSELESKLLPT